MGLTTISHSHSAVAVKQTDREWSSTKGEAGQVSQHHVKLKEREEVFDVFRTPEAATAADMENHISSTRAQCDPLQYWDLASISP